MEMHHKLITSIRKCSVGNDVEFPPVVAHSQPLSLVGGVTAIDWQIHRCGPTQLESDGFMWLSFWFFWASLLAFSSQGVFFTPALEITCTMFCLVFRSHHFTKHSIALLAQVGIMSTCHLPFLTVASQPITVDPEDYSWQPKLYYWLIKRSSQKRTHTWALHGSRSPLCSRFMHFIQWCFEQCN